jgi:hypothetical protein
MEPEEENNIGLTAWDNLTTTTNGNYLIATGNLLYTDSYATYSAPYSAPYDMDFKLPDIFLKVIKTMIPEIKNVIVRNSSLTLNSLNRIENLTINLFIILDETSIGGTNYEERIRDLFRMSFPDIDYVTLNVKQFDSDNKKFSEILRLFGK